MSHREGCWCDACTIRELRVEVERLREFIRTAALNKGVPQSVVDAALAARLAEAEREADLYHTAMESLRSTKMKHGLCQPRERMACTHCNAVDRLDAMLAAYKGRRLVASLTGAAVSAGDVDGSR